MMCTASIQPVSFYECFLITLNDDGFVRKKVYFLNVVQSTVICKQPSICPYYTLSNDIAANSDSLHLPWYNSDLITFLASLNLLFRHNFHQVH